MSSTAVDALAAWGWDPSWARHLEGAAESAVGRVTMRERTHWQVQTTAGPRDAVVGPTAAGAREPVVGDWVVLVPDGPDGAATIVRVLPRRSRFSRGAAGSKVSEQVVAANVDRVWIVHGLDTEPNPRRLERYLALAWESGAQPEIVLTKSDLAEDVAESVGAVGDVAIGVSSWVVSAERGDGMDDLAASLQPGRTVALLGPSGVGKSSLVNRLAGVEVAAVGTVRGSDRKGRHTTTRRELFRLAGGGLLLDTPGMRELQVWTLHEGLDQTFPEIDELGTSCRFRDCAHLSEPGCAVLAAVETGQLARDRLDSYRKLLAEAEAMRRRTDPRARAEAVSDFKTAMKTLKSDPRYRHKRG